DEKQPSCKASRHCHPETCEGVEHAVPAAHDPVPKGRVRSGPKFREEADREHFLVVCLDVKNRPTSINVCHVGSLNASLAHPREVLKTAVLSNAASVLVAHNHPSGDPTPSPEDIEVTKRLAQAGEILGIEVLDHLIVGDGEFVSLKEKGHL